MESDERELLRALADRTRIRILGSLAVAARTTPEIALDLDLPVDQVGQNLAVLGRAGLIRTEAGGRILLATDRLEEVQSSTAVRSNDVNEAMPPGLKQFFRDGVLVSMPAKRSKQLEVLAVLIEDFEVETDYPEPDVNRIIGRRYPDFATIRRDFIDEHMMTRSNGIYRRVAWEPNNSAH